MSWLEKYKECLIEDCSEYKLEKCYNLPNDPELKDTEICATTKFVDGKVKNSITLKKCETGEKGKIRCVHTRVTRLSAEEFAPISSYEEAERLIRERVPELREKKGLILKPEEHFIALNSYVEGIRERGLVEAIKDSLKSSAGSNIAPWFDPMLINQFLYALSDIGAEKIIRKIGKDFIDYLYNAYSKIENGFEMSARRIGLYKKLEALTECCRDLDNFIKCSRLFPYNRERDDIYGFCSSFSFTAAPVVHEMIKELLKVEDKSLLYAILRRYPDIEIEDLNKIFEIAFQTEHWMLLSNVVSHPNATEDMIRKAFTVNDSFVHHNIADNENTPADVLRKIYEKYSGLDFRKALARNPNTPKDILEELALDNFSLIPELVAKNPGTPTEVLEILADNDSGIIIKRVISHPNITREILVKIAKKAIKLHRADLAVNLVESTKSPRKVYEMLAASNSRSIREAVAFSKRTPKDILMKLANDEFSSVREAVAMNKNSDSEILSILSNDYNRYVREEVARNPSTHPDVLRKLSNDREPRVRLTVAENPHTPIDVLEKLSTDQEDSVRYALLRNPNVPDSALIRLMDDDDYVIRNMAIIRGKERGIRRLI
ncbi:MAG: hypothetical protein ACTSRP_26610 [Candidatus Helarchaeota archaeon]